jgi:molybdate transport system ATP-binding protein
MKLSLQNIRRRQGTFELQIDLEISGQAIGIFGPSGAGKTSLLELVAGLRRPNQGRIAVDDFVLTDVAGRLFISPEKRGTGYVPQDLALFPHLSVRKNILYGCDRGTDSSATIDFDAIVEVLEIGSLLGFSVAQLSGGQKQRVAFARALLAQPRLLLLDEPLVGLDHELKRKIIPCLQSIRDEFRLPMLYVSHSPDEVIALCDRVIVLHAGRCVTVSSPAEIFQAATSMRLKPGILPGGA